MFWKSIIEGLAIFGHWQVWGTFVLYMIVSFAFLMILVKVVGEGKSVGRFAIGCLFRMIMGPVLHGILMSLTIAFLLPILLGASSATPVSAIIASMWWTIIIGVFAIVVVTMLTVIPVIGGFIADSPGIQAFMEGVIIFRFLSVDAIDQIMTEANVQGSVYPGFWVSIGYLIIAAVLVRAIMAGLVLLSVRLKDTALGELMPIVVAPVLGVIGGIISLAMYSSYVRLSIMQLVVG